MHKTTLVSPSSHVRKSVPYSYADIALDILVFSTGVEKVKAFLPTEKHSAIRYPLGRCLSALVCLEYRSAAEPAYHEVALCLPLAGFGRHLLPDMIYALSDLSSRTLHAHIVHLFGDNEIGLVSERKKLGYPGLLADIKLTTTSQRRSYTVFDAESKFMLLRAAYAPGEGVSLGSSRFSVCTYPHTEHGFSRAHFDFEFVDLRMNPLPENIRLELGGDEIAETASLLFEKPLVSLSASHARGVFHPPLSIR